MIFVLGGRGFVGSAFVRYCEATGLEHAVITRDNYSDFVGRHCDLFVNANGNSRKTLADRAPLDEFDSSVRSVRQSLTDFVYDHYIMLSSCDVYPDTSSPTATLEDVPIQVSSASRYGFHKYLAELCVQHAARSWTILRLGGFVGPGLWKNAVYDILTGGPIWLDPESELQFLLTDDAARIVLDLVRRGSLNNEIVNVCGKGTVSLREVAAASGMSVQVQPGSPCVRYDVSIRKLEGLTDVPVTRDTVLAFISERLSGERARHA